MDKRNTRQLSVVKQTVKSSCDHPTAEQVYDRAVKIIPSISLRTVYRNLNKLAEDGEIRKIAVANEPDRFDFNMTPHHHINCIKCCAFDDIFVDDIELLQQQAEKKTDYNVLSADVVFTGICPNCKRKTK